MKLKSDQNIVGKGMPKVSKKEVNLYDQAKKQHNQGNDNSAIKLLKKHLESFPNDAVAWCDLGAFSLRSDHQSLRIASDAEMFIRKSIDLDPSNFIVYYHLGIALTIQTRQEESLDFFRISVTLNPEFSRGYYELSKIQFVLGKEDEAYSSLAKSVELDPSFEPAKSALEEWGHHSSTGTHQIKSTRFPNLISMLEDLPTAIEKYLVRKDMPKMLSDNSVVTTFGSCFAGNVAKTLRGLGVDARNITFGESINSPLANKAYIEWVFNEEGRGGDAAISIAQIHAKDPNFPLTPHEHRERIEKSDVLILTLGVASVFVDKKTRKIAIPRQVFNLRSVLNSCDYKMTSVQENVHNLDYIISKLKKVNPEMKIILTLSPVPLNTTFEYDSAVEADCVSKSVLRVTIDEILRKEHLNVYYWPAFEIVKWFGPYLGNVYGSEDGSTIHVSDEIIKIIMTSFVKVLRK